MTVAKTPAERRGLPRLVPGHRLVALLLPHHLLQGGREGRGIKREGAIERERKEGEKEGRREEEGRRERVKWREGRREGRREGIN